MATIAQWLQYYLFFLSFDVLNEPDHLPIVNTKNNRANAAKIWLDTMVWATTGTLSQTECNKLEKIIFKNRDQLKKAIEDSRNGKKVKRLILQ
jgi:hypothetical protein